MRVAFALPRAALVQLSVLDLQGRVVAVLAEGVFPAGLHEAVWGHEAPQGPVPAGIYFVRLASEGRAWTRRIVRVP